MIIRAAGIDITDLIASVEWSGDLNQMARKLTITYLYTNQDNNIRKVSVQLGDRIHFVGDAGELLFDGIVVSEDREESDIKKSVMAYDYAWYLKNKAYGIYRGSPAAVTEKACGDFGIATGYLATGEAEVEVISTGDKTIYQVIQTAYEHPEREYYIYMLGLTLHVDVVGKESCGTVTGDDFVTQAQYKSSIENLINKVVVIDGKSNYQSEIADGNSISRFGQMQEVYKASKEAKTEVEALKLMKGIENSGNITVKGNPRFRTGKSIVVQKVNSKICGKFKILSDSHTFGGGEYMVKLGLKFEEVIS